MNTATVFVERIENERISLRSVDISIADVYGTRKASAEIWVDNTLVASILIDHAIPIGDVIDVLQSIGYEVTL